MKITLLNPPHTAIGSRVPKEHLQPLGLLCIGGPLLDAGYSVRLLNADIKPMCLQEIVDNLLQQQPDVVMVGHSGSSSVHETVLELCVLIKQVLPKVLIVYGGVHPSYFWDETLQRCAAIDVIVRGEGEKICLDLMQAVVAGRPLSAVCGIAYREQGQAVATEAAEMIQDLDAYRIAWELINPAEYSYWGGKRAVVVQFSRGCPHLCNYCGQRGFWTRWRHRDPVKFAKELAWLHREHGVELVNFADELPTGSRRAWKAFLEALIAENVSLLLVGSTRASDIVRDADILHLYKQAGVIRFLLGIESYDENTLQAIRKGGKVSDDRLAIQLLRQHGILSMATCVVGFQEETDQDFYHTLRHLWRYDPDQIQLLYAVPHRWTPFYDTVKHRRVIQTDTRRWDYKHQVLANESMPAWRVFVWFKTIEVLVQLRPQALWRTLFHREAQYRHAMRWYTKIGRRVWFKEIRDFLFNDQRSSPGPILAEWMGESLAKREYVLRRVKSPYS